MVRADKTNKLTSTVLQLDILENEYHLVMLEYRQAYQNYLSIVQQQQQTLGSGSGTTDVSNISIYIQGMEMRGVDSGGAGPVALLDSSAISVDLCMAQCSSNTACTGATYNSTTNSCVLQSGVLSATQSTSDNYAILMEMSQLTAIFKSLHVRLGDIFNQINRTINEMEPQNEQEQIIKNNTIDQLSVKYQMLMYDKKLLDDLKNTNMQITKEYDETGISVRQHNFAYILWVLLALVVFICAIRIVYM